MSFQIEGLESFSAKLMAAAEGVDDAAVRAVKAGGEIVKDELSRAVTEAADRGYATGELAGSISLSNVRKSGGGASVTVSPKGRGKKTRNSDKMWYLEHGTARQAAHPFMTRSINTAKPKVMEAMQAEIGKVLGGEA